MDVVVPGGLDQLDGAAVVHGLLAGGAAVGPGSGGEDHRLGLADGLGDAIVVGLLEIADDRLESAGVADLLGVVGIADQRPDLITALVEAAGQLQCDLPVASGDDDSHVPVFYPMRDVARPEVPGGLDIYRNGCVPQRMK